MLSPPSFSKQGNRNVLKGISYESIIAGKPPIPIEVAPTPSSAQLGLHPSLRPTSSPAPSVTGVVARSKLHEDSRRDSGMAASHSSTARESRTTFATEPDSAHSIKKSQSLPRIAGITASSAPTARKTTRNWSGTRVPQTPTPTNSEAPRLPETSFLGPSTDVPTINFEDLASPGSIQFSKRGSILIGGKRANETHGKIKDRTQINSMVPSVAERDLSPDEERLSRKVRSMYENGANEEAIAEDDAPGGVDDGAEHVTEDSKLMASTLEAQGDAVNLKVPFGAGAYSTSSRRESSLRGERELAGGIEDWQDVVEGDVDRYGFISPKALTPQNGSSSSLPAPPASPRLHRVSTVLQLASEAPRRQPSRIGRSPSITKSTRSIGTVQESNGKRFSPRPVSSQSSYRSAASGRVSRVRNATNRLPYNRERRFMDEAGDMLTLPPGLADIAENEEGGRAVDAIKRKEWEREAKWRKMAKLGNDSGKGGGQTFTFDTTSPKLIERTWKGIPDKWRATAWHAFISASAKKRPGSPTDEELIKSFHELLEQSSPDDVQIDIDVPRTISSHIMFRKRYRGGQRLLFRVLHCLSIYFPDTGYVQGMAALAATILCYYDEEMAFVMLVRMWQVRGLDRLYKSGFEGLMQALAEFETIWLKDGPVGTKLTELEISPTAYGTRWYLTVFNYSIPFPAQLRVWDVFMLLGDPDPSRAGSKRDPSSYDGGLDVLHATSAALIDATREILLDSDFENAMKVLTSWIPIRDEELLMKVMKAEWKLHHRKR